MSAGLSILSLQKNDLENMMTCTTHIGSTNCNHLMQKYVYKRRKDGVHLINPKMTWEKLMLAARAIAAVPNYADICAVSSRNSSQRAILKMCKHVGGTSVPGRFTPGTFTNQIQKAFKEPAMLFVTDPRSDRQAITEAGYVNLPVIALCNLDSPLKNVDIAIPCNTNSYLSIGLIVWLLTREVLILRGDIQRDVEWEVPIDNFLCIEEMEKEKKKLEKDYIKIEPVREDPDKNLDNKSVGNDNDASLEEWGGTKTT